MKKEKETGNISTELINNVFNAFDYYDAEAFCFSMDEILFYDRHGKIIQKLKVNSDGTLEVFQPRKRTKTCRS